MSIETSPNLHRCYIIIYYRDILKNWWNDIFRVREVEKGELFLKRATLSTTQSPMHMHYKKAHSSNPYETVVSNHSANRLGVVLRANAEWKGKMVWQIALIRASMKGSCYQIVYIYIYNAKKDLQTSTN